MNASFIIHINHPCLLCGCDCQLATVALENKNNYLKIPYSSPFKCILHLLLCNLAFLAFFWHILALTKWKNSNETQTSQNGAWMEKPGEDYDGLHSGMARIFLSCFVLFCFAFFFFFSICMKLSYIFFNFSN